MKATASRKLVLMLILLTTISPLSAAILSGNDNQSGFTTVQAGVTEQVLALDRSHGACLSPQTDTAIRLSGEALFTSRDIEARNSPKLKLAPEAYGSSASPGELTNGVTVAGFINGTGDWQMWYIDVSDGARCMLSTLSAQPSNYLSLYGMFGSYPTTSSYDWSWTWGYSITARYYYPDAGRWYIMVYSPSGKGDYLLKVNIFYSSAIGSLTSGVTVTGYLNATGASELWYIYVDSGATSMNCVLTCPSSADFDLYGIRGSYPDTANYDWKGATAGSENVIYSSPYQGGWYIMPYSYFGNGTYQLTVTITYSPVVQYLSDGETVSGTLSGIGDYDIWYIYVYSEALRMRAILTCPSGADLNLYGKSGTYATTSYYDWCGVENGSEDVTYSYPSYGGWYIMVNSINGSGTYLLSVDITYLVSPEYLSSGYPVSGNLISAGNYDVWRIYVGSGATNMHSVLTCPSGSDFDLYGRWESTPTTSSYNWGGVTGGGEDVSYDNPSSGTWYIMVWAYAGNGTYQLTVTVSYSQPYIYGLIIPLSLIFIIIVLFVVLVSSGRRSSDSWGSSPYAQTQSAPSERGRLEERTKIVAPRLVQCRRCGASMKQGDSNCWNCGAPAKAKWMSSAAVTSQAGERTRSGICVVCKRGLEKTDEILFCPYCGGLAHNDHMLEWLHVKDYCPSCGRHLDIAEVKKQVDPKPNQRQRKTPSSRTS